MVLGGMHGIPIGLDHNVVMEHAVLRGYDRDVVSILLPAAENGMMKALRALWKEKTK